jgi:hypothetical protein
MQMLSPDLLDRRALALIELVDIAGRPVLAPAELAGDDMRFFAKGGGRYALLEAPGFDAHISSFTAPPQSPVNGSTAFDVDIRIASAIYESRKAELKLPRNANPADRDTVDSLFQPLQITIHPSTGAPVPATAAAVRVSVAHKTNKKMVGNALVRVRSTNGKFTGTGLTKTAGEALVIIPYFPISFTTGGAAVEDSLAATVTVVADPASVELTDPAELAAILSRPRDDRPLVNPDAIAAQFASPANGTAIRLSTRRQETVKVEWSPP